MFNPDQMMAADYLPNKLEVEAALIVLRQNIHTLVHVSNSIDDCPDEVSFLVDALEPHLATLTKELGLL